LHQKGQPAYTINGYFKATSTQATKDGLSVTKITKFPTFSLDQNHNIQRFPISDHLYEKQPYQLQK